MVDVDRLKDNISVWDVLNEIGATTTKGGRVFCPFCADSYSRNPGASVTADGEHYTCWVCGLSGDIITLAEAHLLSDFKEACEWLERIFNV
jgi:DNA primase